MVVFNPNRPYFAPYGLTCEQWTPQRMRRADRHNEIELNLLSSGSLTYLIGGRKVTVPADRLTVFWAALPHQIVNAIGQSAYFVVTLPLAWFLQRGFPDAFVSRILHGQVLAEPDPDYAQGDWRTLTRWQGDLLTPNSESRNIILLEAEARFRRLAQSLLGGNNTSSAALPSSKPLLAATHLSKAERMACHIAIHYAEPIAIRDVAETVGLHPGYAMTLFRNVFGTTIHRFLIQHRLIHAQRALVTSDSRVIDIALAVGFNSLSRFNAAFRQYAGCTPREFRYRHAADV